ncbi:MAG: transposase [bacterium]|nr:transposase [bacterium]
MLTKANTSFSLLPRFGKASSENLNVDISLEKYFRVEILAYYLMPNHYHLVLQQKVDNGTSNFISKLVNSFTRNFNLKTERKGQIFLKDFKAVSIKTDEQLLHTVRYVHLNGFSSRLDKTFGEMINKRSSHAAYLGLGNDQLVNTSKVLTYFNNDLESYKNFILDRADYQRSLEELKYIIKHDEE